MKRTVEYKVNRDLAEYTSGQHRLPGTSPPSQLNSSRVITDESTSTMDDMSVCCPVQGTIKK